MTKIKTNQYRPLLITYFDLLGTTFTASGQAKNVYCILSVNQNKCLVQRQRDGFQISIDTQRLIDLVNEKEAT